MINDFKRFIEFENVNRTKFSNPNSDDLTTSTAH